MKRQENASPASAGVADLAEFSRLLVEIGVISDLELQTFTALSSEGVLGLSRALVKAGKITPYQAAAIYQKKSRGLLVGNYLILEKLGQGGMGVVFKARHRRLGRIGALKILPPSFARDRDAVLRFRREVEAAGRLAHPNLVAAQDADEDRGVHFLVMDYVEGRDLDRVVRDRGPMAVTQAIDCLMQAARGLDAAHAQGIIHRDIKPGNLMLDNGGTVRVLDLGLARIVDAANPFSKSAAGRLTQSGMYMGTVDFMAPEQAEDSHRVDHRADVYSLGCTFYYLLTGSVPFSGDSVLKRLMAHMERPAPSLLIVRPDVSLALDAAYLKMMAKSPHDRPASMAEVISLLEACTTTVAEAKAAAVVLPETKRELKVFDETPLKRAAAPRTKVEASIFARPKEAAGLLGNDDLSLEDLVMDVRPGPPPTPLPAGTKPAAGSVLPLKRMSSTGSRGRSSRRGLIFLALAAPVVLGAVFVGLAMFRGPARENGPAPAPADTLAAAQPPDPTETTAPAVPPEPAPDIRAIRPAPAAPPPAASHPREDLKRVEVSGIPQQQATVQSLLNGTDLDGWVVDGGSGNNWRVENGELVVTGSGDYRKLGWLLSDRSFSDFTLRLEFQLSKGANSGVALRAKAGDRVAGLPVHPEVSILDYDKRLEETGTFHWSNSLKSVDWMPLDRRSHLKPVGQWNALEIELRGHTLRVNINGTDVLTRNLGPLFALPKALPGIRRESGSIGFQAHTGTVRFRNIRVEELIGSPTKPSNGGDTVAGGGPQEIASTSFFNGKNLEGWAGLKGYWSVRDGAIVGKCPQGKPAHTFLCSNRNYSDFELRFKAKLMDGVGNSGVQFRSRITDRRTFRTGGPQCEIAGLSHRHPPGSLVSEPGGPAIAAPRERVAEIYKAGDFNEFSIRCVGKHVTIRVNGVTTVDADWPTMPGEGIIAWQIHGADAPREVVFKDVTLVEVGPGRRE